MELAKVENNMDEDATKYKVERLEKDMSEVKKDVKTIMTNHLPHIQLELERVRSDLKGNSLKIAGIVGLISALLSILGNKYL